MTGPMITPSCIVPGCCRAAQFRIKHPIFKGVTLALCRAHLGFSPCKAVRVARP